jgi:hypothetical protein
LISFEDKVQKTRGVLDGFGLNGKKKKYDIEKSFLPASADRIWAMVHALFPQKRSSRKAFKQE